MFDPKSLIEKIKALPPEQLPAVESYVDFVAEQSRSRAVTRAAVATSAPAFDKVWNNPEDDAYDAR